METLAPATAAHQPPSNYARFMQADFNHPNYYPIAQQLDPALYHPIASWFGRLILPQPEQRETVMGALFEVYHTDEQHRHLMGKIVRLRWTNDRETNKRFWSVTRQVIFDKTAQQLLANGKILPERINNWPLVNPFESLAGALPADTMMVRLNGHVQVDEAADGGPPIISTSREPVQINSRFYGLVRFLGPVNVGGERFHVAHYNRATGLFDGPEEMVRLPQIMARTDGIRPSTSADIERSPANEEGWYIYGAQDHAGTFVVQALAPRSLLRLDTQQVIVGREAAKRYLKPKAWQRTAVKGAFSTALLAPDGSDPQAAVAAWREGDAVLVVHLWGGIGGDKGEKESRSPVNWGHFAFGIAQVIREPLADELVFDIDYQQVYVHGGDGIVSGAQHWSRYTGDRQFGWLGIRPVQDVLIKLDCFTDDFGVSKRSALMQMSYELESMTARYRIADGRGGTSISAANNCAQDSNQALYAAIRNIDYTVRQRADVHAWAAQHPDDAQRLQRLLALGQDLRREILPLGAARADWDWGVTTLGSSLAESPLRSLGMAIRTWRTMLPSLAVRCIAEVFLKHGALAWVLRTNQVGGYDPSIAPYIPNV
ncbi:MAG: hypothetical protein MI924_04085 [Chloroflexales bacterium]|nr:hypothetical protein [Chloroflexales bacterium]